MADTIAGVCVGLLLGMMLWAAEHKSCTVTIKDMRGVQHQITGKTDD